MSDPAPLKKITSISIVNVDYDIARNGEHYHLVEHKEPDAYCRPVARQVDLGDWIGDISTRKVARVQAILDLLGESCLHVVSLEDELSRAHAALQREAEPDAKPRRAVAAREQSAGVSGILEPGKEE